MTIATLRSRDFESKRCRSDARDEPEEQLRNEIGRRPVNTIVRPRRVELFTETAHFSEVRFDNHETVDRSSDVCQGWVRRSRGGVSATLGPISNCLWELLSRCCELSWEDLRS